jgi:hypothetical protein
LATLGDAVPGGVGFRINDFEPNGLNDRGDVLFGNDLGTTPDPESFYGEGVFLRSHGQETLLARAGAGAPGGGTFDFGFLGTCTLNDEGDAGFVFLLQPAGAPYGVNAGVYRFSHTIQTVTPVVVPGVTPVPGGGVFAGAFFAPALNNRGDLWFAGIIPTDQGVHIPGEDYPGVGLGIFRADRSGHISSVVRPGDAAPGGGRFDLAGGAGSGPWVNDAGDAAFIGHIAGEEARVPGFPPQAELISALASLYLRDGATGQIRSVVHAGDPAPGGGVFRQVNFPQINSRGDVLFAGDLTPAPGANQVIGVFLDSGGTIVPIARPGDAMPGGGHLVTASIVGGNISLNNRGDVVFNAVLDTDVDHDGTLDTGLFQWSHGQVSLLARTGTVLPGVGTVHDLVMGEIVTPPPPTLVPNSGAASNDRGQVLFGARLTDDRSVMLLLTPTGAGRTGGGGSGDGTTGGRSVAPIPAELTLLASLPARQESFPSASPPKQGPAPVELGPRSEPLRELGLLGEAEGFHQRPQAVTAEVNARALEQIFADSTDALAASPFRLDV